MLKTFAVIFGVIFLLIGVFGFIPDLTPEGELFGYFLVNTPHNLIHLVTGIIFIWVGAASPLASKVFFQIFGVIYGVLGIVGFFHPSEYIFGLIANNVAGTWLHVILALIFLWIGFGAKVKKKKIHAHHVPHSHHPHHSDHSRHSHHYHQK
jgi:hypothetical protein